MVELLHEPDQIGGQCLLPCGTDSIESLLHRAVVGAKRVEPVLRRAVAKNEVLAGCFECGNPISEQLTQALFSALQRRRLDTSGRGNIAAHQFEQLTDKTGRGPVRKADLAA